jgi:hypothetical protein
MIEVCTRQECCGGQENARRFVCPVECRLVGHYLVAVGARLARRLWHGWSLHVPQHQIMQLAHQSRCLIGIWHTPCATVPIVLAQPHHSTGHGLE